MRRTFTVEARAERFQRRYTGPWRTVGHEVGPVELRYRYRRRTHTDFIRFSVACHDLWTHLLWRQTVVPAILPIVRWLSRRLGSHE